VSQLNELLSPIELAKHLGVSLRTIDRMRADGRVAYSPDGVAEWLAKRQYQNTAASASAF